MSKDLSPPLWGLHSFSKHTIGKKKGGKKPPILHWGFGPLYNSQLSKLLQAASQPLCTVYMTHRISPTELCIMPVCPHDHCWGSRCFLPHWVKHNRCLEGSRLRPAMLTKPWCLAGGACIIGSCQKLIFRSTQGFGQDALPARCHGGV